MRLTPKSPPGRITRKAREFASEISRLYAEGYTAAAICQVLSEIGVVISTSTVRREVLRHAKRSQPSRDTPIKSSRQEQEPPVPATSPPTKVAGTHGSGREIAEAFVRSRISNSLVRQKE